MLGFTEERRHLVMFACIAPKICPTKYDELTECFVSNNGSDNCIKESESLFTCHITKHWEDVTNYYRFLDTGKR